MTRLQRASATAGASLMLIALASTAQEPPSRETEQSRSTNEMPMKMMHECMGHCQAMSGSMEKLKSTVEQARKSNDPAQMRAALDQVQTHISGMNGKMGGCMQMMDGERGKMDHKMMEQGNAQDSERR